MLSQLTKTIKMALKSTEEERAVLRARSAVQRFPVVEWRQRMEDFHKRSINASRSIAGTDAWRESDCDGAGVRPMADTDDWNPVNQAYPSQPEWDRNSMLDSPHAHTPGSPGQWSQDTLTAAGAPRLLPPDGSRNSFTTDGGQDDDYFSHSRGSTLDLVQDIMTSWRGLIAPLPGISGMLQIRSWMKTSHPIVRLALTLACPRLNRSRLLLMKSPTRL